MGKLHKAVKKYSLGSRVAQGIIGKENYESIHPLGEQAEAAYDAKKASEKALADAENEPVQVMPDEEEIARVKRRRSARRGGGRSATVLSDADSLGG